MRVVSQFEQADSRDDAESVFQERQAAAQKEPGHESPAGPPEAVATDQLDRLVLPETGGPGQKEIAQRGGGPNLDQLGPGSDFVKCEGPGRGTAHHHQEIRDSAAQRHAGQERKAEGGHERKVRAVGNGQNHRRDGHRHDLGVPGLVGEQADHDQAEHDQAANRGDVLEIAGDPGLMPEDVIAGQQKKHCDQAEDSQCPACALAQRESVLGGIVFHPQQDELFLADGLSLFHQHVALGERIEIVADPGSGFVT